MSRGAVDAFEVPDRFGTINPLASTTSCDSGEGERSVRFGISHIQETTAILLRENTCEPPWLVLHRLHILYVYKQYISRFSSLDLKWAGQVVNSSKVYIPNIICRVIVFDLATSPAICGTWLAGGSDRHSQRPRPYQSTHSILTVSPFLIVSQAGMSG